MHAIRAAHAFDGTRFLAGGATVAILVGRPHRAGHDDHRPVDVDLAEPTGLLCGADVAPRARSHAVG